MSTSAIILAAGKSTRMKSRRAKPMHEICGRPMLHYVLQACYDAGCERVMVVVGHGKDEVIAAFEHDKRIDWVEQTEMLGTGHAARMCEFYLQRQGNGEVFILAGDGPLIRGDVLKTLLSEHRAAGAAGSMATAIIDDPKGYGRIVRDAKGDFVEIVEEADATPAQRAIREVFPSYYCMQVDALLKGLSQLTNNNAKHEYYLTDVYTHIRSAGGKVLAVQAVQPDDVLSINTRQQQALVNQIMQNRIQRTLMENGVTIVTPANTYIESGVSIGADTVVYPFTFIGRDSAIGSGCTIRPFSSLPADSVVADGATINGNIALSSVAVE